MILEKLDEQQEEISMRNFSARYLNDSKRLERIQSKIAKIIRDIGNDLQEDMGIIRDFSCMDVVDIFAQFNVVRCPTFVYVRGKGKFRIQRQEIDLSMMHDELVLSSNQLVDLDIVELSCKQVITVENLTTFYEFPVHDSLILYLGGFHNHVRREFLLKLWQADSDLQFYHSGDIDAGGFYILNHLIEKTGIPFQSIQMDQKTLEKYQSYTRPLTKEDRNRLEHLRNKQKEGCFLSTADFSTIDYMLLHNVKLEQENIDYLDFSGFEASDDTKIV